MKAEAPEEIEVIPMLNEEEQIEVIEEPIEAPGGYAVNRESHFFFL